MNTTFDSSRNPAALERAVDAWRNQDVRLLIPPDPWERNLPAIGFVLAFIFMVIGAMLESGIVGIGVSVTALLTCWLLADSRRTRRIRLAKQQHAAHLEQLQRALVVAKNAAAAGQ